MVTAVILINVERNKLSEVVGELMEIEGVSEVHSVAGDCDLVAIARVKSNAQLSKILAERMCSQMPGILRTKTLISLGAHFNYDAEAAFKLS